MSSFTTALSALRALSAAVNSVSQNLANLNTTSYKMDGISFQEMILGEDNQSGGGAGVTAGSQWKNFVQGSIQSTQSPLDAAIQGSGFFLVKSASSDPTLTSGGDLLYTRDGGFQVSPNGVLVTANGARVQGWNLNTATNTISTAGPVQDIVLPLGASLPARASTKFSIAANLDASSPVGSSMDVPLQMFDATGGSHLFKVTLTKTAADTWGIQLNSSDPAVKQPLPAFSPATIKFVNGLLDPATPPVTIGPVDFTTASGLPTLGTLTWDIFGPGGTANPALTQFSQVSVTNSVTQDGSSAATVTGVRIGDSGKVTVRYSNGAESDIAQLALAGVRNPDSLIAVGNNAYRASADSFVLPPAPAGTQGNGTIAGGALESSNVDLAEQLTQLIGYQRSYQANARSITTADELLQETLSLKR